MRDRVDEASQPWGIRVFRYEIADIHVDRGTREAMVFRYEIADIHVDRGTREAMEKQSNACQFFMNAILGDDVAARGSER